jgi:hypothetical protein
MGYVRELDDLPWEVRRSAAATLYYWPKVDGANVSVSATATDNQYEVLSPSGTVVQARGNATVASIGGVSRLALAIPAITTLDERYQVRVYWRQLGSAVEQFDLRLFDVVLWPYNQPQCSANDLLEYRADAGQYLLQLGRRLFAADGDEAVERAAAVCAVHGLLAVHGRIRDAVVMQQATHSETRASTNQRTARNRAALILDRTRLKPVEAWESLVHLYRAMAVQPGEAGSDTASAVHRTCADAAAHAWQMVGPLAYDAGENLQDGAEITDPGRHTVRRRRQA